MSTARWWSARLDVSDVRRVLRGMIDDGYRDDDARAALVHLQGRRGRLTYLDAAGDDMDINALLAEAGAMILAGRQVGEEEETR